MLFYQQTNVDDPEYDAIYEVKEILEYMYSIYDSFIPGCDFRLDKTFIQTFGRINFNVWIITNAARYGIKVCVLSDTANVYLLKVIFYTSKFTWNQDQE